jgi:hypothetical protein
MVRFPHGKQYLFFFYNPGVEIKLLGAWQLYREQNTASSYAGSSGRLTVSSFYLCHQRSNS